MNKQLEFGGKAKGLVLLVENTDLGYKVPQFEIIDTSYYEDFLKQPVFAQIAALIHQKAYPDERVIVTHQRCPKRLEERCTELSQIFGGSGAAVRSSGIVSEDTKKFSGAGIYDTFFIHPEDLNPQSLQDVVLRVYASVQNSRAVKYRQEAGLGNESMGVVIQEFLEPDWSGVMYTSNPSYPKDLSIESIQGRNRVVEGAEGTHIIDYNKRTKKMVFKSEDLRSDLPFDIDELVRIGMALEKRIGASDIEFLVKDGQFYFIQRREITDLQEPIRVKIPRYKPEQFIASTNLKRGTGKVKLPVVKIGGLSDLCKDLPLLIGYDPREAGRQVRAYFGEIIRHDSEFYSGYTLLLPHFHQTIMPVYHSFIKDLGIDGEPSYDTLTPHKKAIITTRFASISSHVMTLARERGIPYAGFGDAGDLFSHIETGDVLSIYFQGREAKVFLEETPLRSIHETNPQVSFDVTPTEEGYVCIRTSSFLDSTKPYTNDFLFYLNRATGQEWRFEPFDRIMGGAFVNPDGRHILMSMSKVIGQYHAWSFDSPKICQRMGYKPLTKKQMLPLIEGYVEHLNPI